MKSPVKLSHFLLQADVLAKSIGLIPYDDETRPERFPTLLKWIFVIQIVNMNYVLFTEIMFVILAVARGEHFIEATMTLSYIGFVFVGDIKIFSVLQKKSLLTLLMRDVREIYPKDVKLQEDFQTRSYGRRFNLISFAFVFIHEVLVWSYNLYTAMSYLIYEHWLAIKIVPKNLPYFAWIPWQWQGHWSYYFLYASQNMAGHTCMSGQLANDLMLCVVALQIIMHFRYLAQRIENYQPSEMYENNKEFLKECIQYHQKILR